MKSFKHYILTILVLSLGMCTQKVSENDTEIRNNRIFEKGDTLPFSGLLIGYMNDNKIFQVEIVNGNISGEYKYFNLLGDPRDSVEVSSIVRKGSSDKIYHMDESVPLTGYVFGRFENGKLSSDYFVLRGLLEGRYREYYYDGSLHTEMFYKDGKLDGTSRSWSSSGSQRTLTEYRGGKLLGKSIEWNDEDVKRVEKYFVDGELQGEYKKWDRWGKITQDGEYSQGLFVGWKYDYDYSQELKSKRYFIGDSPYGEHQYFEKGVLKILKTYDDNSQLVKSIHYSENGEVLYNVTHVDENEYFYDTGGTFIKMVNGDWEYFPFPYKYVLWYNGRFSGYFHYYDMERKKRKMLERMGKDKFGNEERSGNFKEWWENGNIKTEGEYSVGIRIRTWNHYDENGKLLRKEHTIYP